MKRCVCVWLVASGLLLGAGTVVGGSVPDSFTLGRFIPGNMWMYIHHIHSPKHELVDKEYAEVWDAFRKSGILNDLKNLVFSNAPEQERAKIQEAVDTAVKLLDGVEWSKIAAREFCFAQRISPPMPEYVLLLRGAEGSGEKNFKGLLEILRTIEKLAKDAVAPPAGEGQQAPVVPVVLKQLDSADQWSLALVAAPFPYSVDILRDGDLIALVVGGTASQDIRNLMASKGAGTMSILDQPRFRDAIMQVPSPEFGLEYFDMKMMMDNVFGMIGMGMSMGGPSPEMEQWRGMVGKVRGMVDFLDYVITTHETDGQRDLSHSICRIQSDKKDSPICKAMTQRKAFDNFDKYIPADATGFSLSTLIDMGILYRTVVDFIEKDVPGGAPVIAQFKAKLQEVDFDPDRDIFSWFSGEYISISLPSAMASPMGMGSGESVMMFRVSDPAKARERIDAGVNRLMAMLPENARSQFTLGPAAGVSAEGFRQLTVPQLAMMGLSPVFGVTGDWLVIAQSPSALNKCLAAATGDAPNISTNERFKKEGLTPKGSFVSCSFTDLSNMGQEMGMMFAGFGMVGMFIPPDPENKPVRDLFTILTKLGPVMAKLDFFSSEASTTTFDGTTWKTESVLTYKPLSAEPPAPPAAPTSGGKP